MKKINYTTIMTPEDKIRIEFVKHRGEILKFVVQYYGQVNGRWRAIMRIDNCHGQPHRHVYHLHAKELRVILNSDTRETLTEAKVYITKEFRKIKANFISAK